MPRWKNRAPVTVKPAAFLLVAADFFLRVVSFKKKHREAFKFAAESVKSNRILGLNHGYIALASCGRGFKV